MPADPNRLPYDHPSYTYPPSRHPYWPRLDAMRGAVYADNDTETFSGRWRASFEGAPSPDPRLHVEIGCNAGHVILEWAAANPKDRYVGIDWKFKAVFRAAEKAAKRDIRNLKVLRAHAERLPFIFAKGEIDCLYLFFPDPWPKQAHWKNRFVTEKRLRALAPLVRPGGTFHIKTDHAGYFEWMEKALARCIDVWEVVEHTRDLHAGHPDPTKLSIPDVTLFERIFVREGIPIHSVKLRARDA